MTTLKAKWTVGKSDGGGWWVLDPDGVAYYRSIAKGPVTFETQQAAQCKADQLNGVEPHEGTVEMLTDNIAMLFDDEESDLDDGMIKFLGKTGNSIRLGWYTSAGARTFTVTVTQDAKKE